MKKKLANKDLNKPANNNALKLKLHEIIFEAETPEGKLFDVILLVMIVLSIATLMLESVQSYYESNISLFDILEWIFTIFFTIEYFLRLYSVKSPLKYATSFFGIVDLVSIIPAYLTLLFPGLHSLMVIRGLRLVRIFRIFKMDTFIEQGNIIVSSIIVSRKKLAIFAFTIMLIVMIFGSLMYVTEHNVNPAFSDIPTSIYWSIVTITTVGYGDISPITGFGRALAAVIMLLGYVIIAVPTGIVTSSMSRFERPVNTINCPNCGTEGHKETSKYCDQCGHEL